MTSRCSGALIAATLALAACSPKKTQETPVESSSEAPSAADGAQGSSAAPAATDGSQRPGCLQSFAAFDTGRDQRVSLEEFLARPHARPDAEAVFRARDADTDGSLTSDEFCSGWRGSAGGHRGGGPGAAAMGRGGGPGGARGPGAGMGPGMGAPGSRCEAHFARFDADANGNVTEPELAALPHPHGDAHEIFAARDQNHDGLLTRAEFCAPWTLPSQPLTE